MFYRKEDIYQGFVCGICHGFYNDPRLLPCSESACHECIQSTVQKNPHKEFNCNFCHEKHTPPGKDGFLLNGTLVKLMKAKAENVYRNAKVEELKDKLVDIKSKCDELKMSLDDSVDRVKEHCTRLRNHLHLARDFMIEEAHMFYEFLIPLIDKHEQECIDSFMKKKNKNADELMVELNNFHSDLVFKIDEKVVEEAVIKADSHLEKLKVEDAFLEKLQSNAKVAEVRNKSKIIDRTLFETSVHRPLSLDVTHLRELKFSDNVVTSYASCIHLFKNNDGDNFAFYTDVNDHLCMTKFDNNGNVVKKVINAFNNGGVGLLSKINQLKVTQSLNNFIFYVRLPCYAEKVSICGHQICDDLGIMGLFFTLDQHFTCIKHNSDFFNQQLLHVAANSSRVLWIDSSYKFYYLDTNLAVLNHKSIGIIKNQVAHPICDVQMNDQFVFFLCHGNKLKIFEIKSGNLVKEFETMANQIKLASAGRLILFDYVTRIVYFYEQTEGEFCKLKETNLAHSLESGLKINRDQSNCLAFYNSKRMKYFSID
jgi:hypothetical protein